VKFCQFVRESDKLKTKFLKSNYKCKNIDESTGEYFIASIFSSSE